MKRILKENKGITLVALVVTIVVLLILSTITINMTIGENGIITKAQEIARKTNEIQVNSQSYLNELQKEIEEDINSPIAPELKEEIPNAPKKIDGMSPIKFVEPTDSEKGQVVDTDWNDNSWYNYKQNKWANTPTATGSMYAWNQKGGVTASTTGNMTGIYDLSGGEWERTASYVANNHANLIKFGKSIAYDEDILKTESTKYTMVYPHDSALDNPDIENTEENLNKANEANYNKNTKIYGDVIREISTDGNNNHSWNNDYSLFVSLKNPFAMHGGSLWDKYATGSFSFGHSDRVGYFGDGFRPTVVPIS